MLRLLTFGKEKLTLHGKLGRISRTLTVLGANNDDAAWRLSTRMYAKKRQMTDLYLEIAEKAMYQPQFITRIGSDTTTPTGQPAGAFQPDPLAWIPNDRFPLTRRVLPAIFQFTRNDREPTPDQTASTDRWNTHVIGVIAAMLVAIGLALISFGPKEEVPQKLLGRG